MGFQASRVRQSLGVARGGGKVSLAGSAGISLAGFVAADGASGASDTDFCPPSDCGGSGQAPCGCGAGGGAGGSILIAAPLLEIAESGFVSAVGGASADSGGGGGGIVTFSAIVINGASQVRAGPGVGWSARLHTSPPHTHNSSPRRTRST